MKNLNEKEIDDLTKSLTVLGFSEEDIADFISKSTEKDKDNGEQETVEEMAEGSKESDDTKEEPEEDKQEPEETEEIKKGKMVEEYKILKARMCEIEKAIPEIKEEAPKEDIKKSLEDDFHFDADEFSSNIEKSIDDRISSIKGEYDEIIKGLKDELKKIGDTPLGMKSTFVKANFFEKSVGEDMGSDKDPKVLSISKDRDELLKSMEDSLSHEKDPDVRNMLLEGISDFTINKNPNSHGARALAYLSRNKNITLEQ